MSIENEKVVHSCSELTLNIPLHDLEKTNKVFFFLQVKIPLCLDKAIGLG